MVAKADIDAQSEVNLDYAFQLKAQYAPGRTAPTSRGGFFYQDIQSGTIDCPRLKASVYANSGGQYDSIQRGHVRMINAHFMVRASNGEWLYFEHAGFCRPDGYYRVIAYIDADKKGAYNWMNNTSFVVTAEQSADMREVVFTYYIAN